MKSIYVNLAKKTVRQLSSSSSAQTNPPSEWLSDSIKAGLTIGFGFYTYAKANDYRKYTLGWMTESEKQRYQQFKLKHQADIEMNNTMPDDFYLMREKMRLKK